MMIVYFIEWKEKICILLMIHLGMVIMELMLLVQWNMRI